MYSDKSVNNIVRIPDGGRQTSWLFRSATKELNQGRNEEQLQLVLRGELIVGNSEVQLYCLIHLQSFLFHLRFLS